MHNDHRHADLSFAITHLVRLADLAQEFFADFSGSDEQKPSVSRFHPFDDGQTTTHKKISQLALAGI